LGGDGVDLAATERNSNTIPTPALPLNPLKGREKSAGAFALIGDPREDAAVTVQSSNWKRHWLLPMTSLAGVASMLFLGAYLLDHLRFGDAAAPALVRYLQFDPGLIADAVAQVAPVVVALLGIIVTVVAIIVQLAAGRFTGVARMFLRDRVNQLVMGYYVVMGICGLWLSVALQQDFVPRTVLLLALSTASFGLLLMLPYFGYVFRFLEPANLVRRIGQDASRALAAGAASRDPVRIAELQLAALSAFDELTDIASNSISGKDKIIASRAVDAFGDVVQAYLAVKASASPAWFEIGPLIRHDPGFVAMDPESLAELEQRRGWVEWQVLRQYMGIYGEALSSMRDIDYLIAIDTRYIGEAAAERGDRELLALVLRYMNSYLRATLNARDLRTAYNVLNQYRLLAETLLRQGNGDFALQVAEHMSYYGHVGFDIKLPFVTETVAYDLASLCQRAHELQVPEQAQMLGHFLELDRPLRSKSQEPALLGVRKAQTKLATYYLAVGERARAIQIARDMKDEPADRLQRIRDELERVRSKDFWEITDRGRNFEYMPPTQRAQLDRFFYLLAEAQGVAVVSD
jgi:hypothetical protein